LKESQRKERPSRDHKHPKEKKLENDVACKWLKSGPLLSLRKEGDLDSSRAIADVRG